MPQLDSLAFFSQVFWFFITFFVLYFFVLNFILPTLLRVIKSRKILLSSLTSDSKFNNSLVAMELKGNNILISTFSEWDSNVKNFNTIVSDKINHNISIVSNKLFNFKFNDNLKLNNLVKNSLLFNSKTQRFSFYKNII